MENAWEIVAPWVATVIWMNVGGWVAGWLRKACSRGNKSNSSDLCLVSEPKGVILGLSVLVILFGRHQNSEVKNVIVQ